MFVLVIVLLINEPFVFLPMSISSFFIGVLACEARLYFNVYYCLQFDKIFCMTKLNEGIYCLPNHYISSTFYPGLMKQYICVATNVSNKSLRAFVF